MRTPSRLKPFIEQGCLLQVTAGAVAGRFGPAAEAIACDLLQQGLVTILASDAHNIEFRPPLLSEGLQRAASLIGEARAEALVLHTPWQIAQGHFQ
jgi:protein-tyrosine phosphatase